jgi:putative protein-disulfide isomerase
VIVAGESGKAEEMLAAIQRAYYQEAQNPSDTETLAGLAADIGLDPAAFEASLRSPEIQTKLTEDFALRSAIGAYSFPSVGLLDGDQGLLITTGWCEASVLTAALREAL